MSVSIQPWQIWWFDLDPSAGHEQSGKRPAVIVSSQFHLKLTGEALITVLPLTTRERPQWLHRVRIELPGKRTGWAITEQIRTISRKRLVGRTPIGRLTDNQISDVRTILGQMLA
jgi:mRNA interferase MazF